MFTLEQLEFLNNLMNTPGIGIPPAHSQLCADTMKELDAQITVLKAAQKKVGQKHLNSKPAST